MLRGDVVVVEALGLRLGPVEDLPGPRTEGHRAALDPGPTIEQPRQLATERRQVDAEAPERLGRHPIVRLQERGKDVLGVECRALLLFGETLGGEDRLLRLLGVMIEIHRLGTSRPSGKS